MSLLYDQKFLKHLVKFKNQQKTNTKIIKQLKLLQQSPNHPSLRLHKLSGKNQKYYSISVDRSIRIICTLEKDGWYVFDIGTHDQVYKDN